MSAARLGSEAEAFRWAKAHAGEYREALTGEPEYTALAEAAADHFGRLEWLDEETHWIWDVAIDAFGAR